MKFQFYESFASKVLSKKSSVSPELLPYKWEDLCLQE